MEQNHQEALKAKDEVLATAKRDLRDSKEAIKELTAKLKSLEELHQENLQSIANLTVEVKGLHEFKEQAEKEAAKAKRDALLALITCQHCKKRFDGGVFMAWQTNSQNLSLNFYPKPKESLARFWEKKKRLDAVLEERRGPHP
uniref:Uncharacterized protein n=1 Tax=Cannabis sativa TaxID=3483 RepID=A0A803P4K5_CANSA